MLGNFGKGAIEGSTAGFHELLGRATHALHFFGVLEEMDHFDAGVFRAFDLDGGLRFDESSGHSGEVFHGRTKDGDFAEGGGFEDVVASGVDEGATDEDAVGEAIERGQFADGVEEEDGGVVGNGVLVAVGRGCAAGPRKREFGTPDEFAMRFFDKFGGGGEAFGLAGSKDKERFGKIALDDTEGDEGERFFGGNDAAGDDEWAAVAALAFFFEPLRERRGSGELLIVFQIPAYGDPVGGSAESLDAVGVLLRLHQEGSGAQERRFQEWLEIETEHAKIALPTRERAIGNTTADEEDGNFAAGSFAEEVGPNLGFEDDNEGRLGRVEDAADAEGPVEREINDGVGERHALFGKGVAGLRGGRDDEGALRVGVFEAEGEGNAGKGFTDGDSVNPDGAGTVGGKLLEFRNGKAEALAEVREIFAVAKALDEPIGRRQQGGEAHQKAVNEIHSM